MEIQEIKQRLTILKVLAHYNLVPDHTNRLRCPFHNDKTPSFQVYPKTNTWTCFSSNCSAGSGDQIEFIQKKEGITKHAAILKAKALCGHLPCGMHNNPPGRIISQGKGSMKSTLPKPRLTQQQITETLTCAFSFFARSIQSRPKGAISYLESRRLDYKRLSVGYDAHTFHKTKGITREQISQYLQTGLLKPDKFCRDSSYHSRFDQCIVFPMLDKQGNIVSLYGRHTGKEAGHYYLPGEHTGIYPKYPAEESETIILTESIIDAATLYQLNILENTTAVIALYGTNGLIEEHTKAITILTNLKEIVFFFDGDESGRAAIKKHFETFKKLLPQTKLSHVNTPDNEDINSLYVNYDEKAIKRLIDERFFSYSTELSEAVLRPKGVASIENKNAQLPEPPGYLDTTNPDCLVFDNRELTITLWGGIELHQINRLCTTLHIRLKKNVYAEFRDTVDLYSHSQTERLTRQSSEKLEISSIFVSKAITELTGKLENYRQQKREEKRQQEKQLQEQNRDTFTKEQLQQAGNFLLAPELTGKTFELFGKLGLIGQQKNGFLLFFIFLTRLFKNPLHAIVLGSSGSGKTHLLKGVADAVPRQQIHFTTSLSENTLYYTPKNFLKNKILLQEDLDGAYHALLPLRELMSNQSISRFSTRTNNRTGDSQQVYLQVEGPVCVAGATTRNKIYEDNASRSFLIQIEETPQQENEILAYQGRVAAGLVDFAGLENTINLLKACQIQLKPYGVIIPFAPRLQLPPTVFKKLRTINHYLTLIKSITLWNQKQRKTTTGKDGKQYLTSTLEDVEWANFLCKDALLRKSDELGGKTRNFFESLKELLNQESKQQNSFYAKDARKHFRLHPMQLKRFLDELEGRGYIKCRNRSQKNGHEYEIMVWNDYENLKRVIDILDTVLWKLKSEDERLKMTTN